MKQVKLYVLAAICCALFASVGYAQTTSVPTTGTAVPTSASGCTNVLQCTGGR